MKFTMIVCLLTIIFLTTWPASTTAQPSLWWVEKFSACYATVDSPSQSCCKEMYNANFNPLSMWRNTDMENNCCFVDFDAPNSYKEWCRGRTRILSCGVANWDKMNAAQRTKCCQDSFDVLGAEHCCQRDAFGEASGHYHTAKCCTTPESAAIDKCCAESPDNADINYAVDLKNNPNSISHDADVYIKDICCKESFVSQYNKTDHSHNWRSTKDANRSRTFSVNKCCGVDDFDKNQLQHNHINLCCAMTEGGSRASSFVMINDVREDISWMSNSERRAPERWGLKYTTTCCAHGSPYASWGRCPKK